MDGRRTNSGECDHKFSEREIKKLLECDEFVLNARELFEKKKSHETHPIPTSNFYGEIEEIKDGVEESFQEFKKFDILAIHPSNHYFCNMPYNTGTELAKRIQEEREILRQSLPHSIFVRVYDSRVDIMRAVIVGREGTPYHQGLFVFDIFFPSNYPTDPPRLFYHSYGLDFNPNLPKDGKVWLGGNILNQSNILGILVSIQNFIFTNATKPYIDRRGHPQLDDEESPKPNRRIFMQTSEAMLHMLECPPTDFKAFVEGYFRTRAHHILLGYKACADLENQAMNLLFFRLVKAFENNGTYCRHHYTQEQYDLALKRDELSDDEGNIGSFWYSSPKIIWK